MRVARVDDLHRSAGQLGFAAASTLATTDLDDVFERLQASDADVVQEPVEQPYGVRDCAFRDPADNLVRIQEVKQA